MKRRNVHTSYEFEDLNVNSNVYTQTKLLTSFKHALHMLKLSTCSNKVKTVFKKAWST